MEKVSSYLIVDLGEQISVCSSLFLARVFASQNKDCSVYFLARETHRHIISDMAEDNLFPLYLGSSILKDMSFKRAIDFTQPGEGVHEIVDLPFDIENFYFSGLQLDVLNTLPDKASFIVAQFDCPDLMADIPKLVKLHNGVMTHNAELAANLNLQGIPTIEVGKNNKKYGSFLPGSLVIIGDKMRQKDHDDLKTIFEFYKNKKIEELLVSKGVFEVDWQLVYYKYDDKNRTVSRKSYPSSPAEQFMDVFFRNFLVITGQQAFSVDKLLELSAQMDYIDLEATTQFLRKSLGYCLEDLDEGRYPLVGSYWALVQPYLGYDTSKGQKGLRKRIQQAVLGLDMLERIQRRQRKVISMH